MNVHGSFKATVGAEHRTAICEHYGTLMEKESKSLRCGKCGGTRGTLVSRSVAIHAPPPPECVRIPCLIKFFHDVLYCALLSKYHQKRMEYAEKNRGRKIPLKYRTGDDAPKTIKQALLALIILGGKKWLKLRSSRTKA